jgi:hypothetical protein
MLLRKVERFLAATGMPPTRFGRIVAGDPRFVSDLRRGREPRRALTEHAEHFMNKFKETTDVA